MHVVHGPFVYLSVNGFGSYSIMSTPLVLIDMFNDTTPYLDDIFTFDNTEFKKHFPDKYPTELQLNKANTSDKETSFLH